MVEISFQIFTRDATDKIRHLQSKNPKFPANIKDYPTIDNACETFIQNLNTDNESS